MNEKTKMLLTYYLKQNYPSLEDLDTDECAYIIDLFGDQVYWKEVDGEIKFLALYLRLDDIALAWVKKHVNILKDPEYLTACTKLRGPHVHFTTAVGEGRYIKTCIREVVAHEEPKTVSWYRPDFSRFCDIKIGGMLCHHY